MKRKKSFNSSSLVMSLPDTYSFNIHNHLSWNFVFENKKSLFVPVRKYYAMINMILGQHFLSILLKIV